MLAALDAALVADGWDSAVVAPEGSRALREHRFDLVHLARAGGIAARAGLAGTR